MRIIKQKLTNKTNTNKLIDTNGVMVTRGERGWESKAGQIYDKETRLQAMSMQQSTQMCSSNLVHLKIIQCYEPLSLLII